MDELKQQLADARAQDVRLVLIVTLALGVFLMLFGINTTNMNSSDKPPIGTVFPEGNVRYRAGRSLEWNDINAEFPVYQRDSIFTPEGSSATIELSDGGRIDLKPNTLVKLIDLGSRQTEVELVFGDAKGASQITPQIEALRNMIYACQRPSDVKRLSGPMDGELPKLPERLTLGPLLPKPALPPTKPLDSLDYFKIKILTPAHQSTLPQTSLWVGFNWSPVPLKGVQYELEVSRDNSFVNKIGTRNAKPGELLLVNLPGKYFARIRARVGSRSVLSPVSEFTMQKVAGRQISSPMGKAEPLKR
jgi:hypothetical protein